jgi:thiamine-monophosphate kinase
VTAVVPREFALIGQHFRPLALPAGLDLADDAAVLAPPHGKELVIAADAMVAGVHFLPNDPPDLVARKLLRVNLSDLAAMGAAPLGYLLTISAPVGTDDGWFATFAAGLAEDQGQFGIGLLGGDTTATPGPLCLSLTIIGTVAPGCAVRRVGAQPGDGIWVTGTIGDGALGLQALTGKRDDPTGFLARRYHLPEPRLGFPVHLAAAAMDVSDGLLQDLGHLCRAGGVGAEILAAKVPLSDAARAADQRALCLTGGDDYELLMAVRPKHEVALLRAASLPVTRIGHFTSGAEVVVLNENGQHLDFATVGWSHFR